MSSCIKDLYEYDLDKKCSKCGIISLKSIFYTDSIQKMVKSQSLYFGLRSNIALIEIWY